MKCPYCGANQPPDAIKCEYCGMYQDTPAAVREQPKAEQPALNRAAQQIVYHVHNHYNQPADTGFDAPLYRTDKPISPKNRWVAFFLCLFLGWIGAHRFYTGKIGTGILYLLSRGLFFVGWFVDAVMILFGYFKDKKGGLLK